MDIEAARELARMVKAVHDLHEASWDANRLRYTRTKDECTEEATKDNPTMFIPVWVLTLNGYCEVWDWVEDTLNQPVT